MNTILITGGAGFIGSHLTEAYLARGWRVVVVDDFSSGTWENLKAVRTHPNLVVLEQDIRDFDGLDAIFKEYRPEMVNHHAAQKSVSYSVEDPLCDLDINGKGFLNVLLCAAKNDVKTFLFASSGGALAKEIADGELSAEKDWPQLISPYAINKFAGEKYLALYSQIYGFAYMVVRYANVYGPRQIPDGECGVVPIFVNNIIAGRESALMAYEDMPRGCSRDYVYVGDVVAANLLAGERPLNTVINVGTGKEVYTLDLYEAVERVFGKEVPIRNVGPREGDIRRSVLDASRAKELYGWEPQVEMEEGLYLLREYMEAKE